MKYVGLYQCILSVSITVSKSREASSVFVSESAWGLWHLSESELRQRSCEKTQLNEPVQTLRVSELIGINSEVFFNVSKGGFNLLSVSVVSDNRLYGEL